MINKQLRKLKYLCLRLLRINDRAHSIAGGFSIGFLINFIPSFGFGPFLSTIGPKLVKGNPVAGLIGCIAFIWAFPLFFYLNIIVGESLIPMQFENNIEIIIEEIEVSPVEPEEVLEAGLKIGKTFIVGMCLNMVIFGIILYFLIHYIIKKYRRDLLRLLYKKWRLKKWQ
ncbi:DUF2062 domain-containing protein [Anaerobacillus alkalilacustris]|uniref:DUF2062 domain-containing protein n=1 Tax=Anaerobacillus alkalilacustris TaxID=393763 RepID=UPI000A03B261|nr:DUF2062 domain-containing protein [Anaerobacillus alkalilacustris]